MLPTTLLDKNSHNLTDTAPPPIQGPCIPNAQNETRTTTNTTTIDVMKQAKTMTTADTPSTTVKQAIIIQPTIQPPSAINIPIFSTKKVSIKNYMCY